MNCFELIINAFYLYLRPTLKKLYIILIAFISALFFEYAEEWICILFLKMCLHIKDGDQKLKLAEDLVVCTKLVWFSCQATVVLINVLLCDTQKISCKQIQMKFMNFQLGLQGLQHLFLLVFFEGDIFVIQFIF